MEINLYFSEFPSKRWFRSGIYSLWRRMMKGVLTWFTLYDASQFCSRGL